MAELTKRLECLINEDTHEAIEEVARELAGNGDSRMRRSRAARELLALGIKARRKRGTGRSARPTP